MPKFAANLSFLWKELPFLKRFDAAARRGFRHVEFMFPGDGGYEHTADAVRQQLRSTGMTQVLLNAPAGDWASGERGLAGLPHHREADWQSSFQFGLDFASEIGCSKIHVMAGRLDDGASEEALVERLRWASTVAAARQIRLLVEPLNATDFPGYLVPDCETALRILNQVDAPKHCQLQLDVYHLAMTRGVPALQSSLRELIPIAGHIQIANIIGRHEPGCGEIDFPAVFRMLDELGYQDAVGCEFKPSTPKTDAALKWANDYGIHISE